MFQRHKQLYIQNVEFFNFHLSGNLLPDIKKQIGWVGSAVDIIQAATQFFEELKTTALAFQVESLHEQKSSFRSNSKPTESFYQSQGEEHRAPGSSSRGGLETRLPTASSIGVSKGNSPGWDALLTRRRDHARCILMMETGPSQPAGLAWHLAQGN